MPIFWNVRTTWQSTVPDRSNLTGNALLERLGNAKRNAKGTLRKLNGNAKGTLRERKGNARGTLRERKAECFKNAFSTAFSVRLLLSGTVHVHVY